MARTGILYSQVAKAAAQLSSAGKNPTVDNVREQMGSTGSKSTIAPLLKQWKEEHQGNTAAANAGLPGELLASVKLVYNQVRSDAQQEIERARAENLAAVEIMQTQLQQLQVSEGMLAGSVASLSDELARTKDALSLLRGVHDLDQISLASLRSDNSGMEQRLADRALEIKALAEQIAGSRRQFDHFQEAISVQRMEERRGFDQQVARLEHELHRAQQQLGQLRAELPGIAEAARITREELVIVLADRNNLSRCIAEAAISAESVKDKFDRSLHELIEGRAALAQQRGQAELLAQQLAKVGDERDKFSNECAALRERANTVNARRRTANKSLDQV